MNVTMQSQGFEITAAIKTHIHRQLDFNLANFEDHISSVEVYLRDINGPKGGEDMKAVICVRLPSRKPVKVERTRADLYAAISQAARQAKRAVKRAVNRHRHMEKLAIRELRQFPQA